MTREILQIACPSGGSPELFGFDARPHPGLLPRGEGTALARFVFSADRPANPVARFSSRRRTVLLLLSLAHRMGEGGRRPGEGLRLAGMREVEKQKTCRTEMQQKDGIDADGFWAQTRSTDPKGKL